MTAFFLSFCTSSVLSKLSTFRCEDAGGWIGFLWKNKQLESWRMIWGGDNITMVKTHVMWRAAICCSSTRYPVLSVWDFFDSLSCAVIGPEPSRYLDMSSSCTIKPRRLFDKIADESHKIAKTAANRRHYSACVITLSYTYTGAFLQRVASSCRRSWKCCACSSSSFSWTASGILRNSNLQEYMCKYCNYIMYQIMGHVCIVYYSIHIYIYPIFISTLIMYISTPISIFTLYLYLCPTYPINHQDFNHYQLKWLLRLLQLLTWKGHFWKKAMIDQKNHLRSFKLH